ncbi:hypothetical protein NNC19_15340 [Clostridium sp. SHJSY1]|uniref:AbiJ-NTD4 domain-containing protein n=1 Tax=Clostridium sp. SHJSY1 TaxID=2942483 RepID=UPI0028768A7B|nr:hypothetical protein [Clostridium sp. SHJSY1]MDS0527067.1 hypothetical protein [Clostridium sp. SHJSY1]
MGKEYFTDRENGVKVSDTEEIELNVFNAIVGVYIQFQNQLAYNFSEKDDYNNIVRFNTNRFRDRMLGDIPDFTLNEYGWISSLEEGSEFNKYALLDFIEFCWENIKDYKKGSYGLVFYHDKEKEKSIFQNEVNKIFERNGIVFRLNNDGQIERILPVQLDVLVKKYSHTGNDKELNKLIDEAIKYIIKPKFEDRQIAIEKLWDAYERIKTYYGNNKRESSKNLVKIASEGSEEFESLINEEMVNSLTKIGNDFRIRHHEKNKIKINSVKHIDYLFYRMMSLISFLVAYI